MTNTPDKSEMLPCPFSHEVKRGVFVEVDTVDFGFARVSCSDCGCAGPYVTLANHERATKAEKAEAIAAWNTRSRPPADQVPDMVEREIARQVELFYDVGLRVTEVAKDFARDVAAALQAVPAAGRKPTEAMIEAGATAFGIKHQSTCYPSASDWECEDAAKEIYRAMQSAALKAQETGE